MQERGWGEVSTGDESNFGEAHFTVLDHLITVIDEGTERIYVGPVLLNPVAEITVADDVVVYLRVFSADGKTNCCTNISVLGVHTDGGMQEMISLPVDVLMPAGSLSHDEIAIVEPLAIGAHALRRADVKAGETIVIVGCGPIGIGMMALAKIVGCTIIAMDTNDQRLAFVRDEIGVDHAVNVLNDPLDQVMKITGGDLATAVFDATGSKRALESGVDYMSHGGRYVLVGLSKGELTFTHPKIHAKETTLMCSRNATFDDFNWVKETLEGGGFPTDKFITHSVPFSEMIEDFDGWLKPETGVIKAVVRW